ncbi:MAG: hypothetical protein K1X77_05710 [Bacteroidia bacterium]|nr:hypothetical protein [Bacteroidia bacterium]
MKKTLLIFVFSFISVFSFAQAFDEGTRVGSIGIGLGGTFGSYTTTSRMPAISLQYEQGIWPISDKGVISLGGYLGTKSYKYAGSGYTQSWNYYVIGARSAFHYSGLNIEKFDPYAGLMLSYNYLKYRYDGPSTFPISGNYASTVGFSGYLGGRYYFTPKFAGFGEVGFGISYVTIGLAIKI